MTKALPCSAEAENALLGTMLLFPASIELTVGRVTPDDFYQPRAQKIFRAAMDLYRDDKPVDLITVSNATEIGSDELGALLEHASAEAKIVHYCRIVSQKAAIRRLIITAKEIAAREDYDDAETAIAEGVEKLERCYPASVENVSGKALLMEIMKECEDAYNNPDDRRYRGVATWIKELDKATSHGGLPRGHVTIIGAQTGTGKSALALHLMRSTMLNGGFVVDVSLEDRPKARVSRNLSTFSGVQNRKLQRRDIKTAKEWTGLTVAARDYGKIIDRCKYLSVRRPVNELCSQASRMIRECKAELVVFDYLQLIEPGRRFRTRQESVDYTFDRIEQFANRHPETATVIVSQMSRHEGRPQLKNLYHSARLEQGAHTVLLLWSPKTKRDHGLMAVDVAKQKDGPKGLVVVGWDAKTIRFYDADDIDADCYLRDIGEG